MEPSFILGNETAEGPKRGPILVREGEKNYECFRVVGIGFTIDYRPEDSQPRVKVRTSEELWVETSKE